MCQAGVGERVSRVFLDCLLKELQALLITFGACTLREEASFEVKLVCFGAVGVMFRQLPLYLAGQTQRQHSGNPFSDNVLRQKDANELLIELIGPYSRAVTDAQQARRHSYSSVAIPLKTRVEHCVHVKFAPGRDWVLINSGVLTNRTQWPHNDLPDAAEFGY